MEAAFIICLLPFALSLFNLCITDAKQYVGCFPSINASQYIKDRYTSGNMTVASCKDFCRYEDSPMYGLQDGEKCICMDKIDPGNKILDTFCAHLCIGGGDHYCGGSNGVAVYSIEVPGNYSNITTYNTTDEYSSITTQRSQGVTTSKPEITVETTEIGTSEPETTTIQQETSMLPACVCTCKIVTHILSGFTLEENIKQLIENTMIDKKSTSAYKNRKISAPDVRVSSRAIGWIGIVCICVPFIFIICTDVTNWTKSKQKHGGHLKKLRIVKES